ncbi:hypothetical protein N7445_006194 [Penicillium cf. griseofulvum]|nr:hypothetical protein N7445_006194 [Penicillium cf. griseofulvum]
MINIYAIVKAIQILSRLDTITYTISNYIRINLANYRENTRYYSERGSTVGNRTLTIFLVAYTNNFLGNTY